MADDLTLGILSGISYVSGLDYYAGINEAVISDAPMGKKMVPNPSIVMVSVDCDQYVDLLTSRSFADLDEYLLRGVRKLVAAGCDTLVIASNTGHICVPAVKAEFPKLRLLHIADCCATELLKNDHKKVAFLGTQPTMEEDYLKSRLSDHGIEAIVPDSFEIRRRIYDIICQELSFNVLRDKSREFLVSVIRELKQQGATACLLGCTEIELLVQQQHVSDMPIYPSGKIHIAAAAKLFLQRSMTDRKEREETE